MAGHKPVGFQIGSSVYCSSCADKTFRAVCSSCGEGGSIMTPYHSYRECAERHNEGHRTTPDVALVFGQTKPGLGAFVVATPEGASNAIYSWQTEGECCDACGEEL